MGFFSAIKRFWKGKDEPTPVVAEEATPAKDVAESSDTHDAALANNVVPSDADSSTLLDASSTSGQNADADSSPLVAPSIAQPSENLEAQDSVQSNAQTTSDTQAVAQSSLEYATITEEAQSEPQILSARKEHEAELPAMVSAANAVGSITRDSTMLSPPHTTQAEELPTASDIENTSAEHSNSHPLETHTVTHDVVYEATHAVAQNVVHDVVFHADNAAVSSGNLEQTSTLDSSEDSFAVAAHDVLTPVSPAREKDSALHDSKKDSVAEDATPCGISEPLVATVEQENTLIDDVPFLDTVTTSSEAEISTDTHQAQQKAQSFVDVHTEVLAQEPWQTSLTLALRQAEPRLSVWLGHVLEGVDVAGETLWARLRFFFSALEVPSQEADIFIDDFRKWLEAMEYEYVDDFRSELQYRLALALELEDEEDERSRFMLKLSEGLAKTREQLGQRIESLLASHSRIDEAFWEELEEILITADVGYESSMELVSRLKKRARAVDTDDPERFHELLREELEDIFRGSRRIAAVNPPEVILMIGVNGVGKTTTIAKLAYRARLQGKKVLIAAADTFRAAASEQLQVWAERVGAGFHTKGAGADPAAVAYEAMDRAVAEGYDVLFVDTAGRLHTKTNLMEELHKIRKVLGKKHEGAPHRSILVIDATTGQNALSQVKLFGEVCGIDEIILTKLDGTAKGGVVVSIAMQFGIPITFIGLGEKMEDLRPFDGGDFALALLGLADRKE